MVGMDQFEEGKLQRRIRRLPTYFQEFLDAFLFE